MPLTDAPDHFTLRQPAGEQSTKVLNARNQIIADGLSVLSNEELVILGALSERVLRTRLEGLEHVYWVCRLCCHDACDDCPIDAELRQRALDDA